MIKLALSLFMTANLFSCFGIAISKEAEVCARAEERTDHLAKSKTPWQDLYAFYKEFPERCDDGAIAEGLTDDVVRILAVWRDFPKLMDLGKKDPKFFKFIVRHINEVATQEDLKMVLQYSKTKCSKDYVTQCKEIEAAAKIATTNPEADTSSDAKIGVLEYSKTPTLTEETPKEIRAVRAVFYKKDGKWITGDQTIKKTIWTVTFDGKNIGEITTDDDKTATSLAQIGLQKITSPADKTPSIGKLTEEFATWSNQKVYRPLVLTTGKFNNDPEKWKTTKLTKKLETALRKQFRKNFPDVKNCEDPSSSYKDWKFTDKDLKIVKAYKNNNDLKIVGLDLGPYNCDGPPEMAYSIAWYKIYNTGKIEYLDSGMNLVDAGDYDNDGKSELIFQVSRYNRGGYILYSDNLTQHTDFLFSYH